MIESMDNSPWKYAADSPSRQLLRELSQLRIDEQRSFSDQLEKDYRERDAAHREALAAAAAQHDKVRREAELVRERALVEEQLQREIEQQRHMKEVERLKQEAARKQLELERESTRAAQAAEEADRAAEEERQSRAKAAEIARIEKEKRQAQVARAVEDAKERERKRAEAEAKAKNDAESAAKAKAQAALASRAPAPTATAAPAVSKPTAPLTNSVALSQSTNPEREKEHQRYLEIHQNLKKLRKFMIDEGKRKPDLKRKMGDHRREIRKRVGQLTGENKKNMEPMRVVIDVLKDSLSWTNPSVNVLDYLLNRPSNISNSNGPALLLYLLNIFSKSIILQFLNEASVSPKTADPVGIIGISVFAQQELQWNGVPLVDILLAKFHVKCPLLFGIYGNDSTAAGKRRLGWQIEGGNFVSDQRQAERMTGLGAGFAALTLRSFAKSKLSNPLPTWHFWRALASILNVPPDKVTVSHFYALKALIELNVPRILEFFGNAGLVALRMAVTEFPQRARIKDHVSARSVALLRDTFAKEEKLYL